MAIGLNTYKGLGVPRYGESEMRQESSLDMLTLTHSTLTGGAYLKLRTNVSEGSTVLGQDVLLIDEDGGVQALSGSTVKMELNSSGLFQGTTQIISQEGAFVKNIVALSGATTKHVILAANAGKVHSISTAAATSVFVHLPSSGDLTAGEEYEFISNTTAADLFHFMILGANTAGEIQGHLDTTNVVATTGAVTHLTSGALWLKFKVISTVGPIWAMQNLMAVGSVDTTNSYFTMGAGTTA